MDHDDRMRGGLEKVWNMQDKVCIEKKKKIISAVCKTLQKQVKDKFHTSIQVYDKNPMKHH